MLFRSRAKYTMPAHRLNNVPIALYFATHFYFSTYHVFSNMILRKIVTTYQPGIARRILYVTVVGTFAYFGECQPHNNPVVKSDFVILSVLLSLFSFSNA